MFGREDVAVSICKRSVTARHYLSTHHLVSNSKRARRLLTAVYSFFPVPPRGGLSQLVLQDRTLFGFSFQTLFCLRTTWGCVPSPRYYQYTQDRHRLKMSSRNTFTLYRQTSPTFSDISTPSSPPSSLSKPLGKAHEKCQHTVHPPRPVLHI